MARIVKTLRIIRIFKLARHSTGLQALGNTMKANYKELGLLFLLLFMGAIMFASLIFVFEKEDPDTTFNTMFDAYWWAIITMTTVSYVRPNLGNATLISFISWYDLNFLTACTILESLCFNLKFE